MMHKTVERLVNLMALCGGFALSGVIIMTCVSVIGRMVNSIAHGWLAGISPTVSEAFLNTGVGAINGDFELVEVGVAFAIFAFLPLCQFRSGHAVVDLFTARLRPKANRILVAITEVLFAAVLILLTVQMYAGMTSKMRYGEETFILQFPVWWGYAICLVALSVAATTGVYMAALRCRQAIGQGIPNE